MGDFYHPLSPEQAYYARARFNEWLLLKEKHERQQGYGARRWENGDLTHICADVDHSALLFRLLTGKPALPEPPPLRNAYPVYPDE